MVPLILRNPHIYPQLFRVQSFQAAGLGMKALALLFLLALEYMDDCQNYGPFWGTLNIRCRIMIGIQKGTIILITTNMD